MSFGWLSSVLITLRRFFKGFLFPLAALRLRSECKAQLADFESIKKGFWEKLSAIKKHGMGTLVNSTWNAFNEKVEAALVPEPPYSFLKNPVIMLTMFATAGGSWMKAQLDYLESVLTEKDMERLLKEDDLGKPLILNAKYMTSHSTVQHLYSFVRYQEKTGNNLKKIKSITEWGGGYGNMAKLFFRINPSATYTIIDSPVFSCIQWLYLSVVMGKDKVNLITDKKGILKKGKVNLVPVNILDSVKNIKSELFISTWALSESPKNAQDYVVKKGFFGAKKILFAGQQSDARFDSAEKIREVLDKKCVFSEEISFLPSNKYYFN